MPLLNIVGSTNLNNTFFIACVFLGEESTEDYIWAMEALKSVLEQPGFTFPSIIVTDQELALINAVCLVFLSAKRVLCVWHVEKNVLSNVSSYFGEGEEDKQNEFMKAWAKVLSSGSQLDYEENWDTLYNTYWTDYSDLVVYLQDTWLPFKWNL